MTLDRSWHLCRRRRFGPDAQPVGRLDEFRKAFDRIVMTLIDRAEADPGLGDRVDVLALLLRSRRDDGTAMPRIDICDELLTSSVRATKAQHQHWAGPLSGCGATQTCWLNWSERSMRGAATSVGPQFWSYCGRAP